MTMRKITIYITYIAKSVVFIKCALLFLVHVYTVNHLFILEEEVRESQGHQAKTAEDYLKQIILSS